MTIITIQNARQIDFKKEAGMFVLIIRDGERKLSCQAFFDFPAEEFADLIIQELERKKKRWRKNTKKA